MATETQPTQVLEIHTISSAGEAALLLGTPLADDDTQDVSAPLPEIPNTYSLETEPLTGANQPLGEEVALPPNISEPPSSWGLIEQCQRGDRDAFAQLYKTHHSTVYNFILRRVKHPEQAEDLASDTFVRAIKRIGNVTWQGKDIGAWLTAIARNITTDYFRSGRHRLESTSEEMMDIELPDPNQRYDPESQTISHLTNITLLNGLGHLSPDQRKCIVLRFLNGMSILETADAMGKNEGTIKALQFRAVRALQKIVASEISLIE